MVYYNPIVFELERQRYNDLLREAEIARGYGLAGQGAGGPIGLGSLGRLLVWSGNMLVAAGSRLDGASNERQVPGTL